MTILLTRAAGTFIELMAFMGMYYLCLFRKKDSKPKLGVFFAFIYGLLFLLHLDNLVHNLIFYSAFIIGFNTLLKYDMKASAYFALQSFLIMLTAKFVVAFHWLFFLNWSFPFQGLWETSEFVLMGLTTLVAWCLAAAIYMLYGRIKKKIGLSRQLAKPVRVIIIVTFVVHILINIQLYSYLVPNWKAIAKVPGLNQLLWLNYLVISFFIGHSGYLSIVNQSFRFRFKKASQMAENDPLTGLLSRNAGMNFLRKVYNQTKQNGKRLTVGFIDVDDLKVVNDKYGHKAGDHLLEKIAEVIRSNIRDTDAAMRYGGDEFVLVMPDCPQYRAEEIMTQINVYLNRYNLSEGLGFKLKISYGLVEYNSARHYNVLDLISDADGEMYKNKKKSKMSNMSPNR